MNTPFYASRVFVCVPYIPEGGISTEDIHDLAVASSRFVMFSHQIPVTPALAHLPYMNLASQEERTLLDIISDLELMYCDELWIMYPVPTPEMQRQIERADFLGVPVKDYETVIQGG